ncbi:OmpA family protein [Shimia sp.]|uniref:OmpA family protein n=1 Tax=Shimia sp. TaxID=1954381 RepID=UPI0032995C2F
MKHAIAITLAFWPGMALAFEPALPSGTQLLGEYLTEEGFYAVPTGPFANGTVPSDRLPGSVRQRSWRLVGGFTGTSGLMADLSAQVLSAGYDIEFACDADLCGGFDFRFNTNVLPPPEMFVDLSDFLFLAAHRDGENGPEAVSVLVSRTERSGMLQVIEVAPDLDARATLTPEPGVRPVDPVDPEDTPRIGQPNEVGDPSKLRPAVVEADNIPLWLERTGHIVLSDLVFETGSSRLGEGPFVSLESLAAFLNADATRRVALVGHTDSKGSLAQNTELSRKRATSVRQRLVDVYKVAKAQLEARGVGFLSPIASNLTEDGRNANRRVEAVLLNTE